MLRWLALIPVVGLAFLAWGYANIVADPVMRRADIAVPGLARPVRVALIGDVHVQGPDMPPARVARLVAQVNAQKPDLVLLAGDFVGDRRLSTREYRDAEIAAPLGGLRAPMGVFAVLGNHDHWRDGLSMARALEAAGIRTLDNWAERIGPLTLVGIGDIHTRNADPVLADRAAGVLPGPYLAFTHSPDVVPRLPPRFGVLFAAHTHCGQIVLPLLGPVASASHYGERYRCGVIREGARTIVVTSGWGASVLPLRYGAPPDWWMVTLTPA
jgi:predicted MPP superfamily phosphohydrolase